MSLDICLTAVRRTEVYSTNITHNLTAMAGEAGIYEMLWRPEENGVTHAGQMIERLRTAINDMRASPSAFRAHNPENGWGSYDVFVPWLENLLRACEENPDAEVAVFR